MSTRESTDWAEIDRLRAEVERLADELQTETEASAAIESMYRTQQTVNDRLRAELETLKRERDEARARVLDVAQLAGISYEADGVASAPGPHEVILETLREWKHANNLKLDGDALIDERDRYRKALQEIVDGATVETAPAANIARKALEGETK